MGPHVGRCPHLLEVEGAEDHVSGKQSRELICAMTVGYALNVQRRTVVGCSQHESLGSSHKTVWRVENDDHVSRDQLHHSTLKYE